MENLKEESNENNELIIKKTINGYFLYTCINCNKNFYLLEKNLHKDDIFCSKDCNSSFKINEYLNKKKENNI